MSIKKPMLLLMAGPNGSGDSWNVRGGGMKMSDVIVSKLLLRELDKTLMDNTRNILVGKSL